MSPMAGQMVGSDSCVLMIVMAFCNDVGVALMGFRSHVRLASCKSFRCVATLLEMRAWDRFALAEMMTAAGVMWDW